MNKNILLIVCFFAVFGPAMAQQITFFGKVRRHDTGAPVAGVTVFIKDTDIAVNTDVNGEYRLSGLTPGKYVLAAFFLGLETNTKAVEAVSGKYQVDFILKGLEKQLEGVEVTDSRQTTEGIRRLQAVEGYGIYEGKKSEVIVIDDMVANKASNNARQLFSKVAGLNIWESDCAGLQIGVGGRGLNPNRNSNFNTRQNGYDISADALGYPESYYSPAIQAVDRVEIVRGAASLQYGPQFGGLVNFVMKKGPEDKPFELNTEQTVNSLGFYSGFNSIGGTVGKMNYYAYNRYSNGDCWRCNSDFESVTTYINTDFQLNEKLKVGLEYTHMYYLAKQPGGLTDAAFAQDAQQSIRERNWFQVSWNLLAVTADYKISDQLKLNIRNFGLIGGRDALGNLDRIDRADDMGERDLLVDDFRNFGQELRLIYHYRLLREPAVLLVGTRYYNGFTEKQQGNGSAGDDADFTFNNPDNLEGSDFDFPGTNFSVFAENIINISDRFSLTPGIRLESITTEAEGYYQDNVLVIDPNTGFLTDSTFRVVEDKRQQRSFVLLGLGASYKHNDHLEAYANFSQNYRSINFNDIRVVNPNEVVDENIDDERGYNMDLGIRGGKSNVFNFDVSVFYLKYSDRIGSILQEDPTTFRLYRYRTNISDSRNIGLEAFGEINLFSLFGYGI